MKELYLEEDRTFPFSPRGWNSDKHASIREAWERGEDVEVFHGSLREWVPLVRDCSTVSWHENNEYRIVPKPQEIPDLFNKESPEIKDFLSDRITCSSLTANYFLEEGLKAMVDRAKSRDAENGERSMLRTVAAFNALTGRDLTEAEGWTFMIQLKLARASQGAFHADDYIDAAAYAALLGECESA